ncbi:helix-turn-helix domain-containing protein [Microbacterium halophytorum]|uniref:helix-turn-helix domain-containing protein n=1 Tax=Microbacterium halophytorum TaxID=2067568 RepID=UPI001319B8D1|nr:helix-turn-helix transcriptional regulator [Microbacterium halophytorum]
MPTLTIDTDRFDSLRAEQGLDLDKDLAATLGINKSTVSRVLDGSSAPGPGFIAATLQAFPVKFEDVFTIVESREARVKAIREQVRRSPHVEAVAA